MNIISSIGNAICTCEPGLIPKPDTITGCGPECVRDPDCPGYPGNVCQVGCHWLILCHLSSLWVTLCHLSSHWVTLCHLSSHWLFCLQSQRCVPRPDPCQPSPCGPNTECMENRQVSGYISQSHDLIYKISCGTGINCINLCARIGYHYLKEKIS